MLRQPLAAAPRRRPQGFCQLLRHLGFPRLSLHTPPHERRKRITCPHCESTATTERSDRTTLGLSSVPLS